MAPDCVTIVGAMAISGLALAIWSLLASTLDLSRTFVMVAEPVDLIAEMSRGLVVLLLLLSSCTIP